MMQSAFSKPVFSGLHVAIIMDGNGRWATARGRPRQAGHRAGVEAVRRVVEGAPGLGIGTLTLFAFTADNWGRPPREVETLLELLHHYLRAETSACVENGIRLSVIGRRDRLPDWLLAAVWAAEAATAQGHEFHLRLAIDYSARDAIVRAASHLSARGEISRDVFARALAETNHAAGGPAPEVDLLIRSGGEQRLSDCELWECAYAEMVFTARLWPDFDATDLEAAVREFDSRERRFGHIPVEAAS